jgi:methylated-DNA-[protein]-cysteine S-methyltransferase
MDTPCGALWVSGGDRAVDAVSWSPLQGDPHRGELNWVLRALEDFFLGRLRQFPGGLLFMGPGVLWARMPHPAFPLAGPHQFLAAISRIPYGDTMTYGQVAACVGRPRAARAVGAVCRSNPLPVLIPCHRVVGAHSLGGYTPGVRIKESLLQLEGRGVDPSRQHG